MNKIVTLLWIVLCMFTNATLAAAEKAADKIIDEVWQLKQEAKPANPPAENKEGVK